MKHFVNNKDYGPSTLLAPPEKANLHEDIKRVTASMRILPSVNPSKIVFLNLKSSSSHFRGSVLNLE